MQTGMVYRVIIKDLLQIMRKQSKLYAPSKFKECGPKQACALCLVNRGGGNVYDFDLVYRATTGRFVRDDNDKHGRGYVMRRMADALRREIEGANDRYI